MRALVVTLYPPPMPQRDHGGIYRRLKLFVGAIAELCDTIEMFYFVTPEYLEGIDYKTFSATQSDYWGTPISVKLVPRNPWQQHKSLKYRDQCCQFTGETQIAALEASISSRPDFIFAHRLMMMIPILQVGHELPPLFLDLDDVEHRVMFRSALNSQSWRKKAVNLLRVPGILAAERAAIRSSRKTFVCSERDRRHLRILGMGANVEVAPNAVEIANCGASVSPEKTILFIGNYTYSPNVEAAERLISQILPLIRQQVGAARLIIAGNYPELIPAYASSPPNVEFTGPVPDLEPLYARSRVICCPILNGGGTRIKLLEAAAHAKPIVSTAVGAEGLSFENELEILIRNRDSEIAQACCRLLTDDTLSLRLAKSAYRKICSHYEPGSIKKTIARQMMEGLEDGRVLRRA